ncbi:MAG TPA: BTAD domain-containing putative transcriptional regulator [Gemmatimonadales bacterium]|nr:BTAD domain-containing putative transcriptional regulator [Gemmatimonadales bacterium]
MLRLQTLGRFELTRSLAAGEEPIPMQPKRLALLGYLCIAGAGGAVRRDTLQALFWPDSSGEEARRSLRQALYYLRNALGDGVIPSPGAETVAVDAGRIRCDAVELEPAAGSRPDEALSLYRGDFLEGVHLPEVAPELEEWIDATRRRLRAAAAGAAWRLAGETETAGRMAEAVRAARRAVELAPDDEPGVRRLIALLAKAGDRLSALGTYDELTARLQREFGAAPSPETVALGRRLREPGGAAAVVAESLEPAPAAAIAPGAPVIQRRRWWPAVAGLAAVLGIGVALALRARHAEGTARALPTGAAPDRILLADLDNRTRDSLLAGAIGEALRVDLAQSPRVAVLSSQQVREGLARMERGDASRLGDSLARELALRTGAKAYVVGSVGEMGRGYSISAELVAAADGDILAAVRETARDSSELLPAVDRLGAAFRRRLGESVRAAPSAAPLEQVTTRSLEALRGYSEAIRVSDLQGDERRALPLLREAVALDSGFAMAWRKLASVAANVGEYGLAHQAGEHAFQHRDRLPERERYLTMGSYYTNADRPAEAIRAYSALLEIWPTDVRALNNIGFVYEQLRDYRRSEEYRRRALAADSSISALYWNLASALLNQGKLDAASQLVRTTLARFPDNERSLWLEVDIAIARGDLDAAERRTRELLDQATDDYTRRDRAHRTLATLNLMRGRVGAAEAELRALEPILRRDGTAGDLATLAAWEGFVSATARQAGGEAARVMERVLDGVRLDTVPVADRRDGFRGYVYALAGQPRRARALAAEGRAAPGDGIGGEGELQRAEGAALLAEGRTAEAVTRLQEAVKVGYCPICALADLARAYDAAGNRDSALAVWRRYVETPWSERWSSDGEYTGLALARIVSLSAEEGDSATARAAYGRLAALWAGADPEMRPLLRDAERNAGH